MIRHFFTGIGKFPAVFHGWFEKSNRLKLWFAIPLIFLPVVVFVLAVIAPLALQRDLPEAPIYGKLAEAYKSISPLPDTLADMLIEEAFLSGRLSAAKGDSIALVIDIPAKEIGIELRGCRLRSCPVIQWSVNRHIGRADRSSVSFWLAAPFVIEHAWSTIPRIPIKIKKAPRDSIAASTMSTEPRPVEKADVRFRLGCDRDLRIDIIQKQPLTCSSSLRMAGFISRYVIEDTRDAMTRLFHGHLPRRDALIRIVVDREDAKAIFSALPEKGSVVVRL